MKHLAADPLLRETFAYLEKVLAENNKQPGTSTKKSTAGTITKCSGERSKMRNEAKSAYDLCGDSCKESKHILGPVRII